MKKIGLFFLLCVFSGNVLGAVYQWRDEKGRVHFGNIPPKPQAEYILGDINNQHPPQKRPVPAAGIASPPAPLKQQAMDDEQNDKKNTGKARSAPAASQRINAADIKVLINRLRKNAGPAATQGRPVGTGATGLPKPVKTPDGMEDTDSDSGQNTKPETNQATKKPSKKTTKRESKQEAKQSPASASSKAGTAPVVSDSLQSSPATTKREGATHSSRDLMDADAEKCGLFSVFVADYAIKQKESCPGASCAMYTRQLKKFARKKARYCRKPSPQ